MLTRWVVYLRGVRLEWKKPVTFRKDKGRNAYAVGRRTDENVFGSIVDQMLRRLESISVTMRMLKFRGKTTYQTSARCEWILSRKLGGSEDITQTSPVQDPSWSTFHSLTALNRPRYLHGQLSTSLSVFGDVCT